MELFAAFLPQLGKRIRGDRVDQVELALLIRRVHRVLIIAEHELQRIQLYRIRVVEIGVLGIGDGLVVSPSGADERAVGNEALGVLLDGEERRERHQVLHVQAGGDQHEAQRNVVHGGHVDVALLVTVKAEEQVSIVRPNGGFLPGIGKVRGGQRGAVGPFQPFLQLDRVGHAVRRDGIALSAGGHGAAAGVIGVKSLVSAGGKAGAVHRGGKGGIKRIRLAGQAQTQRFVAVRLCGVLEILGGVGSGVNALHVILLQICVVVVVQRQHAVVGHQQVLRLVHQRGALFGVGLRFDLRDQLVVGGPAFNGIHVFVNVHQYLGGVLRQRIQRNGSPQDGTGVGGFDHAVAVRVRGGELGRTRRKVFQLHGSPQRQTGVGGFPHAVAVNIA